MQLTARGRFPELMRELQEMLQQTKEALQKLPLPVSKDPVLELMHLIGDFSTDLHRCAEGFSRISGDVNGITVLGNQFQPIGKAQEAFWGKIRTTAPYFRPIDNNEAGTRDPDSDRQASYPTEPDFLRSEEPGNLRSSQEPIYLNDVVDQIQRYTIWYSDSIRRAHSINGCRATTRELPGYFPFYVVQDLISRSTDQWDKPAFSLVDEIHSIVAESQDALITKHFAHYTEGGLRQTVTCVLYVVTINIIWAC